MKRLIIAIDCDDVIVPTVALHLDHYNKTYGTHIEPKDFYSNDLSLWDVPDTATAIRRVEDYTKTPEYQHAKPFTESIDAIRELGKYHELHLVTGRPDFLTTATTNMLTQYFPDLFSSLEFTNFFHEKARSKADVCTQLNADYLIEDHLHHAQLVAACGTKVLLFGDYPWNQTDKPLPANITRVPDWSAVTKLLTT